MSYCLTRTVYTFLLPDPSFLFFIPFLPFLSVLHRSLFPFFLSINPCIPVFSNALKRRKTPLNRSQLLWSLTRHLFTHLIPLRHPSHVLCTNTPFIVSPKIQYFGFPLYFGFWPDSMVSRVTVLYILFSALFRPYNYAFPDVRRCIFLSYLC